MIAIIDYGVGNLRSVQKGFESVGSRAELITRPEQVAHADKLILPGVGAFGDGMEGLRKAEMTHAVVEFIRTGKPFLGICLGLQLLFERGFEDGLQAGLGVLAGDVVRFRVPAGVKVPHMGWNQLRFPKPCKLFDGLESGCHVYFVHSYFAAPADPGLVAAYTEYGGSEFCAAAAEDNVFAVQFHPEKSQAAGLAMLRNFARL